MEGAVTFTQLISTVTLVAGVQWLAGLWLAERFKTALKKESDAELEALKWDLKVREQAAKVAEYLALAVDLREDSSVDDYRKANRLSAELAMWLPEDIYRDFRVAMQNPTPEVNNLTIIIKVRKLLLGDKAGSLEWDDIAVHAPGLRKLWEEHQRANQADAAPVQMTILG